MTLLYLAKPRGDKIFSSHCAYSQVRPTTGVCAVQEFGIGLCFSIVYGALLTKTNRISRIFNASKRSAKRPSCISPKSQLAITFSIVVVQVVINVIWFLVSPPEATHHHPTREDNLLVCKVRDFISSLHLCLEATRKYRVRQPSLNFFLAR